MKKKIFNIIKYSLFFSIGILLFWLVYREQDFSNIWNTVLYEVNYLWLILMAFLGLLSHISRTLRWKIALEPLNEKPRTINAFIAVMASYFMNILLPRMGEFIRCGLLSKYEKIPFSKLLGTVISERIVDMIMLVLFVLLAFVIEFDRIMGFLNENEQITANLKNILKSPLLWLLLVAIIAGITLYIYIVKKRGKRNKFEEIYKNLIHGIKSIVEIKRYKAYIAHTFFIWTLYFLMLYVAFFSLEFTSVLPLSAALLTFVMTSASMLAPVQAGMGAWHFMAEKGLSLYGIESVNGKIFALVTHSSMNLAIVIFGVICIILIPFINRNYKPQNIKHD